MNQPNLDVITANSSDLMAYSTPTPMSLMANLAANINQDTRVCEPTAVNGMLLTLANPENTFAIELDPNRADALAWSGFNVTVMDGSENPIKSGMVDGEVDAVVANPPFGVMKGANGNSQEYNFVDYTGRSYTFGDIDSRYYQGKP